MLALIGLVVCNLQSQTPKLDQKVSLEIVAATLPEIAKEISQKTGVRVNVSQSASLLKATVLIHDQPLDKVIQSLAGVLELKVKQDETAYSLTPDLTIQAQRLHYNEVEDTALRQRIGIALKALANACLTPATGVSDPDAPKLTDEVIHDPVKLAKWAKAKAQIPKYRALAAFSLSTVVSQGQMIDEPYGYSLGQLKNSFNQTENVRSLDTFMPSANGTQVLIKYMHLSGDMQFVDVKGGDPESLENDPPLIRYYSPPKELQQTDFAKYLAAWEKPRDDKQKTNLDDDFTSGDGKEDSSVDTVTLADHLRWIYDHSKASIIANAFRVPVADPRLHGDVGSPAKYLASLKTSEHFLVRYEDPIVQIKYGGYWRLLRSEPPEPATRYLESIAAKGDPGLFDYADYTHDAERVSFVRFEKKGRFVAKFSLQPLIDSRSALYVLGGLNQQDRQAFLAGALVAGYKAVPIHRGVEYKQNVVVSDYWTPRLPYMVVSDMQRILDMAGFRYAAVDALFQGGRTFGRAQEFLECVIDPGPFLQLEGRLDVNLTEAGQIHLAPFFQLKADGTILFYIGTYGKTAGQDGFAYPIR